MLFKKFPLTSYVDVLGADPSHFSGLELNFALHAVLGDAIRRVHRGDGRRV